MIDLSQLRKVIRSNPALYQNLREYFQSRLRENFLKMVSCEDTTRLHFLRGVAFASLQVLNDLFEDKKEEQTGVKL